MRILIIRHADPDYSIDSLTPQGWKEAELLANKLEKERIEHMYCSPLGRAKDTCFTTAKRMQREKDVQILPWLKEFSYPTVFPSGREYHIPWDMYPNEWTGDERAYTKNWQEIYRDGNLYKEYKNVIAQLD